MQPHTVPLPYARRLGLLAFTLAATAAWTVAVAKTTWIVGPLHVAISIAAAGAWCVLGAVVLAWRGAPSGRAAWVDLILQTAALGSVLLLAGAAVNAGVYGLHLTGWRFPGDRFLLAWQLAQGGLLALTGAAMAVRFGRGAGELGATRRATLLLWVGVLHGAFFLLLVPMAWRVIAGW